MSFHRMKLFARMFLLFCLIIIISQWMMLGGLNFSVKGEATSTSYRAIDLYTQKEPYGGRGPNLPSDTFAPQEEVIFYANVTYRGDPVPDKPVTFAAHGPLNQFENLSLAQTTFTDMNGIANASFRLPWPSDYPREAIFGLWNAVAVVDIAEVPVNDTVDFLVGWIIELLKVETADVNNLPRISFMRGEDMCFRLTVKNIAMTHKIATLTIDVYDNLSVYLGQVILVDEQIAPGITVLFIKDLLIPESASSGDGVAYANAYTATPTLGGVPWCPQVSTTFSIVKIVVHDVAVISVVPSVTEAFPCQTVNVSVVVRNEGSAFETFDVNAYYDSALIGTFIVSNLAPQMDKNIVFEWSTSCVQPGNYTLSAVASVVPGEVNIEDNSFIDGIVQIKALVPPPPPPVECVLPRWLLAFLFLMAVLIGAILIILVGFIFWWMSKRRKEREVKGAVSPVKPYEEHPFRAVKTCNVCGREFSGVHTFCPYCMSFHGKDNE